MVERLKLFARAPFVSVAALSIWVLCAKQVSFEINKTIDKHSAVLITHTFLCPTVKSEFSFGHEHFLRKFREKKRKEWIFKENPVSDEKIVFKVQRNQTNQQQLQWMDVNNAMSKKKINNCVLNEWIRRNLRLAPKTCARAIFSIEGKKTTRATSLKDLQFRVHKSDWLFRCFNTTNRCRRRRLILWKGEAHFVASFTKDEKMSNN